MPFPGSTFKVTANETTLGPGRITVLENSFLFEADDHGRVGFDLNALRLVRTKDINGFDTLHSAQGAIHGASFVTVPRYIRKNEGIDKDIATNPLDWPLSFWKLHTITGAVVARCLTDRTGVQSECSFALSDEEFESELNRAAAIIAKLPSQRRIENHDVTGQELDELERELAGGLLTLTDGWLKGGLSLSQRERVGALDYLNDLKRYELGWYHSAPSERYSEMSNQDYKENADDWLSEESKWGTDLLGIAPVWGRDAECRTAGT